MFRLSRRLLAIMTTAIAGVVTHGLPASAESSIAGILDLQCGGSLTSTYSPPLTMAPQMITTTTTSIYSPCLSATHPSVTSGTRVSIVHRVSDCLDLLGSGTATHIVTWNTDQNSTFLTNFTSTTVGVNRTVTFEGVVTDGLFTGAQVLSVQTYPSTDVTLCTAGLGSVSSVHGELVLKLTSVL